jgi:hypothetical protein
LLTSNINVPSDSFVSASGKGRIAIQGLTLKHLSITILAGALFLVTLPVSAQTPVEVAKLLADDGLSRDTFGLAVALDGDTTVIGAPNDDDPAIGGSSGSAYIFVKNGMEWVQQAKLVAEVGGTGDQFGNSVALSGNTVVIGSANNDDLGNNSGSAYVFVRSGTSWAQQQKLLPDDGAAFDFFGNAVAVDGDMAVIGASDDDDLGTTSGSAYVFVRNDTIWAQSTKLLPEDGKADDGFGVAVAVSGDSFVIGAWQGIAPGADRGSAYVFSSEPFTDKVPVAIFILLDEEDQ